MKYGILDKFPLLRIKNLAIIVIFTIHSCNPQKIEGLFWIEIDVKSSYFEKGGLLFHRDGYCYPFIVIDDSLIFKNYTLLDATGLNGSVKNVRQIYHISKDTLFLEDFVFTMKFSTDTLQLTDVVGNAGNIRLVRSHEYTQRAIDAVKKSVE